MKVSVITPTADRPVPFHLCEFFMSRQTRQPDEWIVADGGVRPVAFLDLVDNRMHLREHRAPGAENLARNLLNGLAAATGDVIIFMEDDDWYAPGHIETMVRLLDHPTAIIAGGTPQHYYHVPKRLWRTMRNEDHSSLCQTAIRRGAEHAMRNVLETCLAERHFYIDIMLWRRIARAQWARTDAQTCIGIKGLPGQPGLGIGHRPVGTSWNADPKVEQLRNWIGSDAAIYMPYSQP